MQGLCFSRRPRFGKSFAGISLLVFAFLLEGCSREAAESGLAVGEPVPNLMLMAFDGEREFLSVYQGRLLVLNVWAPWCAPCLEEMPSLERLSRKLDRKRFAVIGLTVDEERYLAQEFLLKNKISFSNYLDQQRRIVDGVLGVDAFPQTFVISPERRLLARVTGWQVWDTREVVEALERHYRSEIQARREDGPS